MECVRAREDQGVSHDPLLARDTTRLKMGRGGWEWGGSDVRFSGLSPKLFTSSENDK